MVLIAAYPAAARQPAWAVSSNNNIMLVSPGSQGRGGGSYTAISSSGRYVAFESYAADLVPGHIEDSWDAFVSDLEQSQTQRISLRSDGSPVYNPGDYTSAPSIDGSGRYVAFMSRAGELVPGDENGLPDIFLRDRQAQTTRVVSVAADGGPANGPSFTPVVSAGGRFVAFQSMASNLVAEDTNDAMDVFLRDMVSGATQRVSITDTGEEGWLPFEYPVSSIAISADGRLVAFAYENLPDPGRPSGGSFIYLRDVQSATTHRVAAGTQPALSGSGRFLVFLSDAALAADDDNHSLDVYFLDRQSGALEHISPSTTNSQEIFSPPDVSDDGRYVVFESNGGFATGQAGAFHIYLHDRRTGSTGLVDRAMNDLPASGESHTPTISADGSRIAFTSTAANLAPNDTNNASDVFVYLNTIPQALDQQRYFLPILFSP